MTVDPGLVLKVINGLEGVDGRNASVSKAEEEIPEVGKMQDGKRMARGWEDGKMTRAWQDGKRLSRYSTFVTFAKMKQKYFLKILRSALCGVGVTSVL